MTSQIINAIKGIRQDDIIIALIGLTGAGKSYFIDLLTGQADRIQRSGSLLKDTREIRPVRIKHPQYDDRIVIVDTPGFDHTTKSDAEILGLIARWLEATYEKSVRVSGIIYLHRITDNRMVGPPCKDILVPPNLCGDTMMGQVVLVTTMWKGVEISVGEMREAEIKERYWKILIDRGSRLDRLTKNDSKEAWRIVDQLIEGRNEREEILLQEELADLEKNLNKTQEGKALYASIQQVLEDQKDALQELLNRAKSCKDPTDLKELREEFAKIEERFRSTFGGIKRLKVPLGRQTKLFFLGKKTRAKAVKILA